VAEDGFPKGIDRSADVIDVNPRDILMKEEF
jgi:hypothetical protein